ncbi:AbrB/MazE/SpoVT family DNA-binding domain-containing protein [Pseudomonas psychrophila]|uniref:AbrB/MazE/SpoVT family DNA-binding domain-containing protein n=1 Tax=Pseudomonas psychrophila TaxID=122355 RepID=UPI003823A6CD
MRKPPMKIMIEEWDGDGAIRIPDEALQELELDVGDSLYLIEEFVGNTRCLVLSKMPQIADRIDELTEAWSSGQPDNAKVKLSSHSTSRALGPKTR